MEFDKDGDFEFRSSYSGYYGSASNVVSGDWEFSSDKEEIELDFDDGSSQEIEITRLTNKELEGELSEANKKKIFPQLAASKGNASLSTSRFEAEKR
jgi:hypothetical protein